MDRGVEIRVSVWLPWAKNELEYVYNIDRKMAGDALSPILKYRSMNPYDLFEARRKHERRASLLTLVSKQIAGALMHACEKEDVDG